MESTANRACGVHGARLNLVEYAVNFSDSHAPLTKPQALIEAERCYYCYDAPCTTACPTSIDIPSFIARIAQGNERGAAKAILEANPLGGMCARVCPTETLCEQACVRNTNEDKPVEIGSLQRYATDALFDAPGAPLFTRAPSTGKRIAVVGAGPAGLACAHGLALRGNDVVLFDANAKLGGLNEYGLATYKTTNGFAQKEVDWLLSVGGISVRCNQRLGRDMTVDSLLASYDAVFLGIGLSGVNAIGIAEPQAEGLRNAVEFIAELRQAHDYSKVPVGRRVVVIGGGMTAVDAAVQATKLGAEDVTIVYRRGASAMSASVVEQRWAQTNGVKIRHWSAPREVLCDDGKVTGVRFVMTSQRADGGITETDETYDLPADMVLKAIGQTYTADHAGAHIALQSGRIATDEEGRTNVGRVWAGGDCRFGGRDLTVEAVEHGKVAAQSIHAALNGA
ncbi:MAG: NAD(P)-dependent oxidoreductase [Burkholderiaceae bacterium]|jgi:glutamate synthase (NADPH/NADH) small chain|nr:NAD(P)-dependent oxidoreductase [Burkholderiaceae bacterium]